MTNKILQLTTGELGNKGQELMFLAVTQHFDGHNRGYQYAADPWFGTYEQRARLGLLQTLRVPNWRNAQAVGRYFLLKKYGKTYGIIPELNVDAVVDFAGFAYSDFWGPDAVVSTSHRIQQWKKAGKKIALMPQGLGPFRKPDTSEAIRRIVDHADIVFARDKVSFEYVTEVTGPRSNLHQAPDFTSLVKGLINPVAPPNLNRRYGCIVPNLRMISHTKDDVGANYIPFLVRCIREMKRREIAPVVLLHDYNTDDDLVPKLEAACGEKLEVMKELNPAYLKGVLGHARVVVGSRYHALCSTLSQAVPSICTSWAHKYEMLFTEYGCPESVLPVSADEDRVHSAFAIADEEYDRTVETLKVAAERQKASTVEMWKKVDLALGLPG